MDRVVFKEASCSNGEHHGHTLALSDQGMVYAFGDGYKGERDLSAVEAIKTVLSFRLSVRLCVYTLMATPFDI